jgi:rubrerythrin
MFSEYESYGNSPRTKTFPTYSVILKAARIHRYSDKVCAQCGYTVHQTWDEPCPGCGAYEFMAHISLED